MRVAFEPDDSRLRRAGRPPVEVPEEVRTVADRTHATGQVARIEVGPGEEQEARQILVMVRRYAKQRGWRAVIQPRRDADIRAGGTIRFMMRDKAPKKERARG